MANQKKCSFDGRKFDSELTKRGIASRAEAARQMGWSDNYFNNCSNAGSVPLATMYALEAKYGIKPEDVAKDEPKQLEMPIEIQTVAYELSDETISKLEKAMYRAFKNALKGD